MVYFSWNLQRLRGPGGQLAVISFYVFREIYVSLLSTQHWSFISSVLDNSSSSYLVSFAGIVSISSAVGSCAVEWLVKLGGVWVLLLFSFLCTLFSFGFAEIAYALSTGPRSNNSTPSIAKPERAKSASVWKDSWELMLKHYTLKLLFFEAILHQACSNMLNLMFHDGLRKGIVEDSDRAALVGRFFAYVNIAACLLTTFVMPRILSHSTLPKFLLAIPIIVFFATALGFVHQSLLTVMLGFGSMKVLEYSVMTSAMEMIYMPMGHEVRYLGKELIRFFGARLGKSGTSLLLSAASAHFQPSLSTQTAWSGVLAGLWGGAMYFLSEHLNNRNRELLKVAAASRNNGSGSVTPERVGGEREKNGELSPGLRRRRKKMDSSSSSKENDATDTTSESGSEGGRAEEEDEDGYYYYQRSRDQDDNRKDPGRLGTSFVPRAETTFSSSSSASSSPPLPSSSSSSSSPSFFNSSAEAVAGSSNTSHQELPRSPTPSGLRKRRGGSSSSHKEASDRAVSPPHNNFIFDANVFDATGFYLGKSHSSNSVNFGSSNNLYELDCDDKDTSAKVAMVRIGSSHVSLNYLAALSASEAAEASRSGDLALGKHGGSHERRPREDSLSDF